MKITRHITDDKLTLLSIAGIAPEGGSGWDYAIPQSMFDELMRMGIEEPGRWFVADCTKTLVPQLHHIGEAWVTILHHRSKANEENFHELFRANSGNVESPVFRFITDFPENAIWNEADVGLSDINHIVAAFYGGYAQGQKDLLPLVNEGIRVVELHDSHWTDVRDILRKIQHAINQHE